MHHVPSNRFDLPTVEIVRLAILTMVLGAFAIGLTEFAVTGLLPQIAADLGVSIPAAGTLVTAYAIRVVVGAPLLTAVGARLSQRTLLLVFMGLFALGNGLAAAAPDFGTLLVARFLSGLPHGAFFGVAGLLAAQMGGARRASAVGRLFLGLTVANLIGVPAATAFGSAVGWRPAFALIAAIALLCVGGMAVCVPHTAGRAAAGGLCAESAAFRSPAVSLALAMVVLGCGGLFTFATYIAPMTTEVTGWPAAAVPVQLAVLGLGMTVGTFLGGRLADRVDSRRAVTLVLGAQSWPCSPPSPPCTCRCWPRRRLHRRNAQPGVGPRGAGGRARHRARRPGAGVRGHAVRLQHLERDRRRPRRAGAGRRVRVRGSPGGGGGTGAPRRGARRDRPPPSAEPAARPGLTAPERSSLLHFQADRITVIR